MPNQLELINQSITDDKKARIYFKDLVRPPLFGKFVKLADAPEIEKKGFVRFVVDYKLSDFEQTGHVMFTRLFTVESFNEIKLF